MNKKLDGLSVDSFKDKHEPKPVVLALREEVERLKRTIQSFRLDEGRNEQYFYELMDAVNILEPIPIEYSKSKNSSVDSPIESVFHFTDWHYGEVQLAKEVEGINEFSPEVALKRVNYLVDRQLEWIKLNRASYKIDTARIIVTGDLISGDIHKELEVTAAFPSPVQSIGAAQLLASAILKISPFYSKVIVDFIVADNHSRLTHKPQAKEEGLNSFNYIVGHYAKESLKRVDNIDFRIHEMHQKVIDVNNFRYLTSHGHGIQGWAGIPFYGIERKVGKEALKRMQVFSELREELRFDKLLIGHFHEPLNGVRWRIGGSLSGTSAYDHREGRFSRPAQTAWMVHPKHGEFNNTSFIFPYGL